jgi:hypothetical protein
VVPHEQHAHDGVAGDDQLDGAKNDVHAVQQTPDAHDRRMDPASRTGEIVARGGG